MKQETVERLRQKMLSWLLEQRAQEQARREATDRAFANIEAILRSDTGILTEAPSSERFGKVREIVDGLMVLNLELGRHQGYLSAKAALKPLDCLVTPAADIHLCGWSRVPGAKSVKAVFVPRGEIFAEGWLRSRDNWASFLQVAASKGFRPANDEEILALAEQLGDQERGEVIWVPSRDAAGKIQIYRLTMANSFLRRIMHSGNWAQVGFRALVVLIRSS